MMGKIPQKVRDLVISNIKAGIHNFPDIANMHNVGLRTVQRLSKELRDSGSHQMVFNPSDTLIRSDVLSFIRKNNSKHFTTKYIADRLSVHPEQARSVINYLIKYDGYNIVEKEKDNWYLVSEAKPMKSLELSRLIGKEHCFGIVSDTHLCSTCERLDVLEAAYDEFARRKITDVIHAGNMVDGEFKFNLYEINRVGIHNQAQYVADHYPQRSGMTTYYVTGTCHEGWYQDRIGLNVGWYIQKVCQDAGRNDMVFIGHVEQDIVLKQARGETRIRVMHPGGGSAYALSYPSQKMVESFQGGEKPQVLILGHYHKFDFTYPREVATLLAGCTQDQTRFMRKKSLAAMVGFSILKIGTRVDGTIGRCNVEWYPFYDRQYHQKLNTYDLKKNE